MLKKDQSLTEVKRSNWDIEDGIVIRMKLQPREVMMIQNYTN